VIDLETTGLDPSVDDIVSFAAVPVRDGRVIAGAAVTSLVRPGRPPSPESVRIHGLRAGDLDAAPPLDEVLGQLIAALDGAVLVAHHASMERSFLTRPFARHGVRFPRRAADTEVLGRLWLADSGRQEPAGLSLSALARELGRPVHRPHDALGDALTTAQAFIALAAHLERGGPETVARLVTAQRRLANLRLLRPLLGASRLG
jgi:DNA polymerase-3 subunit epsilon